MLVRPVSLNGWFPMLVTLDGIEMLVRKRAPINAASPMDVTVPGMVAVPLQVSPSEITPEVIVKDPLTLQFSVVTPFPFAGVEIKARSSAEMVAVRTEYLRI